MRQKERADIIKEQIHQLAEAYNNYNNDAAQRLSDAQAHLAATQRLSSVVCKQRKHESLITAAQMDAIVLAIGFAQKESPEQQKLISEFNTLRNMPKPVVEDFLPSAKKNMEPVPKGTGNGDGGCGSSNTPINMGNLAGALQVAEEVTEHESAPEAEVVEATEVEVEATEVEVCIRQIA
eukprot:1234415-Pleurochrysis_carterae.AAC.1